VDVTQEQAVEGARLCGINLLAQMAAALDGDLDRVVRVVKLGGFVQAGPDFIAVPATQTATVNAQGAIVATLPIANVRDIVSSAINLNQLCMWWLGRMIYAGCTPKRCAYSRCSFKGSAHAWLGLPQPPVTSRRASWIRKSARAARGGFEQGHAALRHDDDAAVGGGGHGIDGSGHTTASGESSRT
jgi:hypothetical protein